MSWGIEYDSYLSGVSISGLQDKLTENEDLLQMYRDSLLILCAGTPADVKDEEGNITHWDEFVNMRFNETWNEMLETMCLITRIKDCMESENKKDC